MPRDATRRILLGKEVVRMFARVNIFEGPVESFDKSLQISKEQAIPPLREADGSVGILILGDRSTGRSYAITLWRDEAALRASEEMANRVRTDTSQAAGEQVVSVERHEVLLEERW